MSKLFTPLQLGDIEIPNRVVLAPLTRCRASEGRVPNALMRDYYVQRASAGFMLTEATAVTPMGVGYPDTPGIWSAAQIEGWKAITSAVHAARGRIYVQLWHVGRISHPFYLDGATPVAPSAIAASGHVRLYDKTTQYPVPRALELAEIPAIIEAYRRGAENAKAAGFDGVELHGANGYLPDQFLEDGTNKRTDAYGGPIQNRARFMLEAIDAILSVWKPGRVGVHLSPRGESHSISDSNRRETFGYVAKEFAKRKLAFICSRERLGDDRISPYLKECFGGPLIANEGFTLETATAEVDKGTSDAVAFGRIFISNPDLPLRLQKGAPLNPYNTATFYGGNEVGYTDYPALAS